MSFSITKSSGMNEIKEIKELVNAVTNLCISFKINEFEEKISVDAMINNVFDFGDKFVYTVNYRNLKEGVKENIFRYLLKKHLSEKQCN